MSSYVPPRVDIEPALGARPLATWTLFHSIGIFLLGNVVIGQLLIGSVVLFLFGAVTIPDNGATTPIVVASMGADVAMVATILVWLRIRRDPVVALIGVPARGTWLREIGVGVGAGVVLYLVVGFVVSTVVSSLLQRATHHTIITPRQLAPNLSAAGKVLAAILAIAVAPPAEELFFRGIMFRGVRDRRGFAPAAAVSAVAFGLAHWTGPWRGALVLVLSMVVTGLGLAFVYDRRKNIVANIAAHATFNIIGIILLFGFPRFGT